MSACSRSSTTKKMATRLQHWWHGEQLADVSTLNAGWQTLRNIFCTARQQLATTVSHANIRNILSNLPCYMWLYFTASTSRSSQATKAQSNINTSWKTWVIPLGCRSWTYECGDKATTSVLHTIQVLTCIVSKWMLTGMITNTSTDFWHK